MEEHIELVRKFAEGTSDLLLAALHKQRDDFASSELQLGERIDKLEEKAKELKVEAIKEAVTESADLPRCCCQGDC